MHAALLPAALQAHKAAGRAFQQAGHTGAAAGGNAPGGSSTLSLQQQHMQVEPAAGQQQQQQQLYGLQQPISLVPAAQGELSQGR